jgi:hypothetical protein
MYADVIAGLVEVLEGVSGIKAIHAHEPTKIGDPPEMYLLLNTAERVSKGGVSGWKYSVLCRLCIRWVDNEMAEQELMPFVNSVPAAIEAPSAGQLHGTLLHGAVAVNRVEAVFVSIGGVLYRALDFYVDVLEKGARGERI